MFQDLSQVLLQDLFTHIFQPCWSHFQPLLPRLPRFQGLWRCLRVLLLRTGAAINVAIDVAELLQGALDLEPHEEVRDAVDGGCWMMDVGIHEW